MKCRNLVFQLDGTIWRTGALGLLPLKRHPDGALRAGLLECCGNPKALRWQAVWPSRDSGQF
jgi:hypothetical protein